MNDHIDVFREVIECSNGIKISSNDDLQQILESRPPFCKILSLKFRSHSHRDHDPAFEQIDDMCTQETCPSRDENAAAFLGGYLYLVIASLNRIRWGQTLVWLTW